MLKLKYQRVLLIVAAAFLVYKFIDAVIHRPLPDNPIYWIAAIIEIGLAFLTYSILYHYAYYKKELKKRYSFLVLAIIFIAIGAPIVFYNTNIAGLKIVGGTFYWFLLTSVSFALYRSFRKPIEWNKIHDQQFDKRMIRMTRIFCTVILSLVVIAGLTLVILDILHIWPLTSRMDPSFEFLIPGIFFILSILSVIFGLYWPRISGWFYKRLMLTGTIDVEVYYDFVGQYSSFMFPAIMGFIIGMMVGVWYTWLPFFTLSIVMLVIKYPTNARLNQCIRRRSSSVNSP